VAIWYILRLFGIFFPILVCCTKNNLAALVLALSRASEFGGIKAKLLFRNMPNNHNLTISAI
jgi:hypothetical protein